MGATGEEARRKRAGRRNRRCIYVLAGRGFKLWPKIPQKKGHKRAKRKRVEEKKAKLHKLKKKIKTDDEDNDESTDGR